LESQFATNHFGPFLLTKLLAPKLLAVRTTSYVPRVVFVASAAHARGPGVDLATLRRPDPAAKYNTLMVYHQVKCANVTTAIELSRRAHGKLNAYSLHPGGKHIFL
jgi:NAD(P)-dependent dehydrogenase (short-subunit alcohol dehydrogenase family)